MPPTTEAAPQRGSSRRKPIVWPNANSTSRAEEIRYRSGAFIGAEGSRVVVTRLRGHHVLNALRLIAQPFGVGGGRIEDGACLEELEFAARFGSLHPPQKALRLGLPH